MLSDKVGSYSNEKDKGLFLNGLINYEPITHDWKMYREVEKDITQHEIQALKTKYNLADAHTHQSQSEKQREIVANLPDLWYQSEKTSQAESEYEFIKAFYEFHGQYRALERSQDIHLVYAASIGMHITATYLMKEKMKVGVIEPCFDNLPDLLRHMEVPLTPLDESIFIEPDSIYDNLTNHAKGLDAILLVDPNNPTGFSLVPKGKEGFMEVVRYCCDFDKVLILDFCFSSFLKTSGIERFDVYEILEDSGVKYIAMEDTGKTWPLQDAKCSTILVSKNIYSSVYPIVTSVLLNVSPFILNLVRQYIETSDKDGFRSVKNLIDLNRCLTRSYLNSDFLKVQEPLVNTSVAWVKILDKDVSATELCKQLLKYEVYVLSGKYFYWSHKNRGERYIRIALARDSEHFEQALIQMKWAMEHYCHG